MLFGSCRALGCHRARVSVCECVAGEETLIVEAVLMVQQLSWSESEREGKVERGERASASHFGLFYVFHSLRPSGCPLQHRRRLPLLSALLTPGPWTTSVLTGPDSPQMCEVRVGCKHREQLSQMKMLKYPRMPSFTPESEASERINITSHIRRLFMKGCSCVMTRGAAFHMRSASCRQKDFYVLQR